jgi:hypothetical protein
MSKWENKLDKVFARVQAGNEAEEVTILQTTDSDLSEITASSRESRVQEEKRVYMEMCELLDSTLHHTIHTILNGNDSAIDTSEAANITQQQQQQQQQERVVSALSCVGSSDEDEDQDSEAITDCREPDWSSSLSSLSSPCPSLAAVEICLLKVILYYCGPSCHHSYACISTVFLGEFLTN